LVITEGKLCILFKVQQGPAKVYRCIFYIYGLFGGILHILANRIYEVKNIGAIDKRLIIGFSILLCFLFFFAGVKYANIRNQYKLGEEILLPVEDEDSEAEEDLWIQVYVAGEVKSPGVYKLPLKSRVHEAIEMAGGVLETAEIRYLDMARILEDEETVLVPAVGETLDLLPSKAGKVNINTASAEEMASKLTGIGPALSQRIVDYRNSNGPFKTIEDIKNVNGIGDKRFQDIENDITVR